MDIQEAIRTVHQMHSAGVVTNYAIGGAVGATFYLEPVSTLDVDIFVAVDPGTDSLLVDLQSIFDYLKSRGYAMEGEYVVISGWPVQFLPSTGPLIDEALRDAVEIEVEATPARVFSAEHLAAVALQTGRAKDKARLLQFVESGILDNSRFQQIVERFDLAPQWQRFQAQFLDNP